MKDKGIGGAVFKYSNEFNHYFIGLSKNGYTLGKIHNPNYIEIKTGAIEVNVGKWYRVWV